MPVSNNSFHAGNSALGAIGGLKEGKYDTLLILVLNPMFKKATTEAYPFYLWHHQTR